MRAGDVQLELVADEQRPGGVGSSGVQRIAEDVGPWLSPADLIGNHDGHEEVAYAGRFEDGQRSRAVVEVGDDRETIILGEASQQRPVVRRKRGRRREGGPVRVDQRLGHRGLGLERQPREEIAEALGRRHLAVVDRPLPLGLVPAGQQRVVAGRQRDGRRVSAQQLVEAAGRRPDDLAVDLDGGQLLAIEVDERVEEIEEDRGVADAQRGLRFA